VGCRLPGPKDFAPFVEYIPSASRSDAALASALAATTLEFVAPAHPDGYVAAALRLYGGGKRIFVLQVPEENLSLGREIQARVTAQCPDAKCSLEQDPAGATPKRPAAPAADRDAVFLLESHAERLSASLMDFVNLPISIVAPFTAHHFRRRPVYLITVPKSGTHMLFALLAAFNLAHGGEGREPLLAQHSYCISAGNSHTQAWEFYRLLRDRPQGGADHPMFVTPTLFLYRNPLDVLVSEAFYYQDPTKTSLAYYFASLGMEERLLQLIGDDPLVRSIRRRMRAYLPWLRLPNVIPLSFEELVGPQGGGSLEEQLKTIWSLQLKLHVPGSPAYYAAALFRRDSETFRKGAIHSHLEHFTEPCRAAFGALNQDFMHELGYDLGDACVPGYVPRCVDDFRHRPLVLRRPGMTAEKAAPAREQQRFAADKVYACRGYLAAGVGGVFCAQPASAPRPVDPRLAMAELRVHVAPTWDELIGKLAADPLAEEDAEPRVVPAMRTPDLFYRESSRPNLAEADVRGFNIVEFDGQFYCLDMQRGKVDVQLDDMSGVFVAPTADAARAYCESQDESLDRMRSLLRRMLGRPGT